MSVLSRGQVCRRCHTYTYSGRDNVDVDNNLQDNGDVPITQPTMESTHIGMGDDERHELIDKLFPNANSCLSDLLTMQSRACHDEVNGKDSRSRRWPSLVLSMAMRVWIASPASYRILQNTLHLPSESLLQAYKNTINKQPGINESLITWMTKECERTGSPKEGGIIFDEMAIQPGVQMNPMGKGLESFGFVDFGSYNNGINSFLKGETLTIAANVLQFVFLSYNGFRFPFAYFLTNSVTCGHLTAIFWDIVNRLKAAGFFISYVCMDGAATHRSFMNKMCIGTSSVATNIAYLNAKLCCIMDFSHVLKKLRNSLYASGMESYHTRQLQTPHGMIFWKYFTDAYKWDKGNFLRLHRRLTNEHFNLNSTLKMRNYLAEQVLNNDMVYLITEYQKTLEDPHIVEPLLQLLKVTSKFIEIFRSMVPISSTHDERLTHLQSILLFFDDWEGHCKGKKKYGRKKIPTFITIECYMDIVSCIKGFIALCHQRCEDHPITPALINSDICENIFCQARSTYNGPNTNPDATQYRYIEHTFTKHTKNMSCRHYSTYRNAWKHL